MPLAMRRQRPRGCEVNLNYVKSEHQTNIAWGQTSI